MANYVLRWGMCVLMLGWLAGLCVAAERHVGAGQTYSTIQAAIDAAADGDEIIVHPGAYGEMVQFKNKDINVHSLDPQDPDVVETTVIDGGNSRLCVYLGGGEPATARLAGFTITNGRGYQGAGIYGQGADLTIECNIIENNYVQHIGDYHYGKGAGIWDCDGLIERNQIVDNINANINYGAGAGLAACDGTIRNNDILRNKAIGGQSNGGGLYNCNGVIENNLIADNVSTATLGKGGGLYYCQAIIRNNIIVNNLANYGAALDDCDGTIAGNTIYGNAALTGYAGGLAYCGGMIVDNIIWGNTAPSDPQISYCDNVMYCCVEGGAFGTGNISLDPLLVNPGEGDYHLQADSPCIDAGGTADLAVDYDGNGRPYDGTALVRGDGSDYDIGACEYRRPETAAGQGWLLY